MASCIPNGKQPTGIQRKKRERERERERGGKAGYSVVKMIKNIRSR